MSYESKAREYTWLVKGLSKVMATLEQQMTQPERDGTFDDWSYAETHGIYITSLMDNLADLAGYVDPSSVKFWQDMKQGLINIRISAYKIARQIDGPPDLPEPTPEQIAKDEAEKKEALRTGGLSLLRKTEDEDRRQESVTRSESERAAR